MSQRSAPYIHTGILTKGTSTTETLPFFQVVVISYLKPDPKFQAQTSDKSCPLFMSITDLLHFICVKNSVLPTEIHSPLCPQNKSYRGQ